MQYLDAISKRQDDLCSFPRQPFIITVIHVYALTSNAEEAEVEQFYEDIQDPLELITKKSCPFHYRGLECKSRKSRDTRVTGKFGVRIQSETGQRLTEFCRQNALVIANTLSQQHKRRLYTCTSPDSKHRNQIGYTLCSQRWRSSISSVHSLSHVQLFETP